MYRAPQCLCSPGDSVECSIEKFFNPSCQPYLISSLGNFKFNKCKANQFINMCLLFCQPQIETYLPKATHPEGPQSPEGPMLPEEPTMPEAPIAPVSPTTPGLAGWRRARAATWRSASAWAASAASWLNAWGACPAAALTAFSAAWWAARASA